MWESSWLDRVRDAMAPVQGRTYVPRVLGEEAGFDPDRVAVGYRLGLLNYEAIVEIELARLEAGLVNTTDEEQVALLLSDDFDRVGEIISGWPLNVDVATERDTYWLYEILRLFLSRWEAGAGDPLPELDELTQAWGGVAVLVYERVHPRGLDAVLFGFAARNRLLERVRKVILDASGAAV